MDLCFSDAVFYFIFISITFRVEITILQSIWSFSDSYGSMIIQVWWTDVRKIRINTCPFSAWIYILAEYLALDLFFWPLCDPTYRMVNIETAEKLHFRYLQPMLPIPQYNKYYLNLLWVYGFAVIVIIVLVVFTAA